MTLIEMLIVIVIIAIAATGASYGLGAITRANLRSAAVTVAAASRFAYGRAIAQNTTVRLHLNIDPNTPEQNTLEFQEAHGRIVLARTDDARRRAIEEGDEEEDAAAVDPWVAASARLEDTLNPSFGASAFSTIPGRRYQAQPLASGVTILKVIVPHELEPVEEGTADVYYWPGGQTEHAIIQLGDSADRVYSVEIHPLTGRGRVYNYAFEPEEMLDDGTGLQRSEVDD